MTDPLTSQWTNGGGCCYSSAGLTWPRRGRPSSVNFRPLRCTHPVQSPEGNMNSSQPFSPPSVHQRSGFATPSKSVKTLKEYDQEIDALRKENFNLKLRLYFIEHDLEKITNPKEREVITVNLQLRMDVNNLQDEVANKSALLRDAMAAFDRLGEQHKFELQRSRETQMRLEAKIEELKQDLEKEKMQTPRSSDAGSELYRQAFGLDESVSGKSSPEYEASCEQMKLQYLSELEKLQCVIEEKDKEIKNMRTVIEDFERKNKLLEEKVRKRNIAIQGLFQLAKKKENLDNVDEPQGSLQKSLIQAIESAHTGNRDSVISNMDDIRRGLSELLSVPGSEVRLCSSEDVEHFRSEISRKDEVIQALEDQLIDQTKRVKSLEETASGGWSSSEGQKIPLISSSAILEQECERLQKAVREKDLFIQELLDERTKMTSEHEKAVQSFVSQLQSQTEDEHNNKIKDNDIYGSESLKMLQERICEKDAEISVRKKTIELLNFQLTECRSELQAAVISIDEKERKLVEVSNRCQDLQNELAAVRHEMQMVKAKYQNTEKSSVVNSFEIDPSDDVSRPSSIGSSKPLIDFDDSLKSGTVLEKKHASLTEIKELQRSLEESRQASTSDNDNMEFHGQHSSLWGIQVDDHVPPNPPDVLSPCLLAKHPSSVHHKDISETVCVRTPRNETIRVSFNVSRKVVADAKPEELLDIMEKNIEDFERRKFLQQLEDQNTEIAKLGRRTTIQEDMASVLAEDKKCLQQEMKQKESEVQMLTSERSELEKQVIALQSQLHSAAKRVIELERIVRDSKSKPKTPVPKSSATTQTDRRKIFTQDSGCSTTFSDFKSNLATFGQSDSINTLKEEICILALMIDEKDQEILAQKQSINKLESELKNMIAQSSNTSQLYSDYSEGISIAQQQLTESQDINSHLFQHLQEVARFMESLLPDEGKKLDVSSLTLEDVNCALKHINDSLELSGNLTQSFSEVSKIFDADEYSRLNESLGYPQSEFFKSGRISLGTTIEDFRTSSRKNESRGSEYQVVLRQQSTNGAGKSCKMTSKVQHSPAMETVMETFDSDQLTILGTSCSEDGKSCLNEQNVLDLTFSEELQDISKIKKCSDARSSVVEVDMRNKHLSHALDDAVKFECDLRPQRLCWYGQDVRARENVLHSCLCYPNEIDFVLPVRTYQRCSGVACCNISSDSDIWSEPDRNLSLQRIGIDLEAPSFHTRSPPKKRKNSRDKQFSDDCSSDNSFAINGIPKGKSHSRRRKSMGSLRRETVDPKVDILMESQILALERSVEDKLVEVQRLSETVQHDISGITELADKSPDAHSLMIVSKDIYNLQSILATAMEEFKILKDTTQESSHLAQERHLSQELKLYSDEILSKIDDIDQVKAILVKERCARESLEKNLCVCQKELFTVKQKLSEAILKLQEENALKHDELVSNRDIQRLGSDADRVLRISAGASISNDIDHLKRSLAQEKERNVFLNKQINDILNENKKLKIESEQLQSSLMTEQRNSEEVRQQLKSEQDVVKHLRKEKNASESKSADLTAEMVHMRASLTELQDHNKTLNRQINDLANENRKIKLQVDESQIQLNSEREQLEKLNVEHLHKQESFGELAKARVIYENKISNLTTEVETLKVALSQKEDNNLSLNKQINDLINENWKIKKEMEQVELHLRTEVEHLEALRKAKHDLHQQNMDLITEKGDLEKRLYHSEERLKTLSDEKTDLSTQLFEEQRERKSLTDKIKVLEDQKVFLEKEINKCMSEIHSSDSVCDVATYDLKQTKEKLKKLELQLHQCVNELAKVKTTNEFLLSEKKSLSDELESLVSKVAELTKQNGEIKKLLKERTNSYNEMLREKATLVDQIENLKVKKVQAESSRDKLISEYDSLAHKIDSLDRQLKDSDLSLQKNKDEQEHLKQQTAALQNKIKLKESVIKDLEGQHDTLQEQLNDLQHNLNKNDINIKNLEEENHSLELQILGLQKQLKKTSSHLEVKGDEISHLQENIFNLEQKVKDKEATQKRTLDEKKASEEQIYYLEREVKKQESFSKQLKQQAQGLEEQVSSLELQLHSKELLSKKSEDEMKAWQAKFEEKDKSMKKSESTLKKMELKLSTLQDHNAQLQQKVKVAETGRKFSEGQAEMYGEEVKKLREVMLTKSPHEPASESQLSITRDQLNHKNEYCQALENTVAELKKQIIELQGNLQRTSAVAELSKTGVVPAESKVLIPSKVFSEPRSSQDYHIIQNKVVPEEKDVLINSLQMDNSDLKQQIEVLNKKFNITENAKKDIQEENLSLWKTLYGSEDEKTDIIKTLEAKNKDLKNQLVDLEGKLESSMKVQQELEEENDSLKKTLYGKQGEETDLIKRLEQKNRELRDQLEVFQSKLKEAEESKQNLKEEKESLWKTLHGSKDERNDVLRTLQLKNDDLKSQIGNLQMKLDASEKAKCVLEEEKNSLWKTLYGQPNDKIDITKVLEEKNNELNVKIEVLEKKLSHCEKDKFDIEEKKNTLWKTMYGSQDEKMEAMKRMEEKNNDLRGQIAILEKKLNDADKTKAELEEEKNSMWKTLCGSEDEKTDLLQQMETKNVDLKSEIETLKKKLISSENSYKEMEEEKSSLWKTLYGSEHEKSDIIRSLEVKNNDLKGQVHILGKKLEASEKVKKDLEDRINSLRVTLYGSSDEKADAVKSIELKNHDLLAELEVLKRKVSDLEKEKTEIEGEKASLWKTLCGNEGESTDIMRQMEQKNHDLSDQLLVLKKKLSATEKTLKEVEDEKTALWNTLYGSEHEKSDMIKRLEQKNKDLQNQNEELRKKLNSLEKAQQNLEEQKNSLWMALHGSDDEKTHEIKSLELKNGDLKGQLDVLERKLSVSEKLKNDFEEEKNTLWKNMYGSQDEKAAAIKKLNMEISDLKSVIHNQESKLSISEKARNELEVEKNAVNEKLSKSIEENADITNNLELKGDELKNEMKMLEEKLKVTEDLKKAIEEDRNSLYNQLLGDSSGAKLEGMLKETQIYIDQVKKQEQEIAEKNAVLIDMKKKLFASENSVTVQQNAIESLKKDIYNVKMQLQKACAEREWFQNQYIDSQREVIRATQSAAAPGTEIREEDIMLVHGENMDLKKQITDLMSQLQKKDTVLSLPPVKTELFAVKLPTTPDDKAISTEDPKLSSEMKRSELEKLHVEKNYLQKVVMDLKQQMEAQASQQPTSGIMPEKVAFQKELSDFSEDIAKQLAHHELPDTALKEQLNQVQNERDYYKNLVDKFEIESQPHILSLQEKSPATFTEVENSKLRKENSVLKGELLQLHARVKKREHLIRALSNKIVELSQSLKDNKVSSTKEMSDAEKESDSLSHLASQIVERSSKIAERSLSEVVMPEVDISAFQSEVDSQLLSVLHPSLRHAVPVQSETLDLDAKSVQNLKYKIEELENQLEDTRMDNYRLQEEVNTLLLKFGIQNNQLVCEKCGKSADISSTQPSLGVTSVSKFTSFRKYLEKDLMFSKEESINKLSECKWKLQNEVLNMQKRLCVNKPTYLENQESFNDHIAKIVDMEYPKIPVRIFSEPLLSATENQDIIKSVERFELLWKSQVLHLERDIKCLHNYRMFLEQFVVGVIKELNEATKKKPGVSSGTGVTKDQPDISEIKISVFSQSPQAGPSAVFAEPAAGIKSVSDHSLISTPKNGILSQGISLQEVENLKKLPADRTSSTVEQTSVFPVLGDETVKRPTQTGVKPKAEVIDFKELDKKIEKLQSENKRLHAENKTLSREYENRYKNELRQWEKRNEDLEHSLESLQEINEALQLELNMYHEMLDAEPSKEKSAAIEKQLDGYVRKQLLMDAAKKTRILNSKLQRLTEENKRLRRTVIQLSSPARKGARSRVPHREELISDEESEKTVTLSRSESQSSLGSIHGYEVHSKHYAAEPKGFQEPWDRPGDHEELPFATSERREKFESIPDTHQRSHFSSPDLGIESDPNHELFLSEQVESDERSYMKSHLSKQPVTPTRGRQRSSDALTSLLESLKLAASEGSLRVVGPFKEYSILKKEINESLILIRGMSARAKECVEYLSRSANPHKNLGYTTLKDIMGTLSDVNVCQVKAQQGIRSFWVSSVHATDKDNINIDAVLQQNEELTRKLEAVMESRRRQKAQLEQAFVKLRAAQENKKKMEKAIAKQLTRTKKVLRIANSNLEGTEPKPGSSSGVPQKKNNPSSDKSTK